MTIYSFRPSKHLMAHGNLIDFDQIMSRICINICECDKWQYMARDIKYRRIFYELWKMNPNNMKNTIHYRYILEVMWRTKEIQLMNCILRDEDLGARRQELLQMLVSIYVDNEMDDNDEFLETFRTHVLVADDERTWFDREIELALIM